MNTQNFILTSDKETMENLQSLGFTLIGKEGNYWRFLNDSKMNFEENKNVVYTNKISI